MANIKNRMMRKIICIAVAIFAGLSTYGQKKIKYEFPKEMLPEVQAEYLKLCDKGRILYQLNCSSCHSTFKGKRELIPDFTYEQLSGYAIRVSNGQHEMSLLEEQVTPEELALISTFLIYKKKDKTSKE